MNKLESLLEQLENKYDNMEYEMSGNEILEYISLLRYEISCLKGEINDLELNREIE